MSTTSTLPDRWVGIDWGTTNIRAYLCNGEGEVLGTHSRAIHITDCAAEGWHNVLDSLLEGWPMEARGFIVACGMVGAKFGWCEAPYVACPAGVDDLVAQSVSPADAPGLHILPGLSVCDAAGNHDVIRGEETQLLGLFEAYHDTTGVICAPGTHTKWIEAREGIVTRFFTAMTGELFGLLGEHSILSQTMSLEGPAAPDAFERGLDQARTGAGIQASIFKVRANVLFDDLTPVEATEFLSGLLIGDDVRHALEVLSPDQSPVPLIGPDAMCDRYERALNDQGVQSKRISAEIVTVAGLVATARELASARAGVV